MWSGAYKPVILLALLLEEGFLSGSLTELLHEVTNLEDNKAEEHADEHGLSLEPGLVELVEVGGSVILDTHALEIENELLDGDSGSTENEHAGNGGNLIEPRGHFYVGDEEGVS